ncbi:MAG: ATP-dependent protease, partial [Smithella sp.]
VPSIKYRALSDKEEGESSSTIKERVNEARNRQIKRYEGSGIFCNARMTEKQIKTYCSIDEESHRLLEMAIEKLGLSARAINRILKVSRTIADLENKKAIESAHVAEAIQYRSLDRSLI